MDVDLRLGPWQRVLADVESVDATIVDAPYSKRVHGGNENLKVREAIGYGAMDEAGVREHVDHWAPRTKGWFCTLTSHDLVSYWSAALKRHGRYVFAPVPVVDVGMTCRMRGDGPSSWTCHLVVSRPRTREFASWGTLRGLYLREKGDRRSKRRGGKPLGVMRQIVADYSRAGDLVLDTHAGEGTTLLAAALEGRRGIGAELSPDPWEAAMAQFLEAA